MLPKRFEQLPELMQRSDIVSIHTPNTAGTRGLISREMIGLMKPTALLINYARGPIVDSQALADALTSGKLWGAALDVFVPEPLPADSPLWDIPNLLITPHVAGGMRLEASRKSAVAFCLENVRRFAAGEPLRGVARRPKGL